MVNIILVDKNGDLKLSKYNKDKGDELYKKCKFKLPDNFEKRTSWVTKKSNNLNFKYVTLYSRNTGKANTENKYDFPPPVDNLLFFGVCALVAEDKENNLIDLSIDEWNKFYEFLFGGFENLADTAKEDENEIALDGNDPNKDELFQQCLDIISKEGKASTSLLQRKLQIGYNRAARIIDQLEDSGFISPANHVGKREVFYDKIKN